MRALAVLTLSVVLGCGKSEGTGTASAEPAKVESPKKVLIVHAPGDDVPSFVHDQITKANAQHRRTLVYIGATDRRAHV